MAIGQVVMSFMAADAHVTDVSPSRNPTQVVQAAEAPGQVDDGAPLLDDDHRANPSRGIVLALLISLPIWALIALAAYLLL
ncbi:hypothetical protein [Rhodopila sp.]|uniref:hypothetical protein n=1 Tax=Rhodopila sp. TaxID=2480087 RepID=UPI003D0B22DD